MDYSLSDIREGLAANLSSLDGVQVNAYLLSNITPPSVQVQPGSRQFHDAMQDGEAELYFTVQAFVALTLDIGAQKKLDAWLGEGDGSVKTAIESDTTLGGLVSDVTATEVSEPKQYVRDGQPALLGAEWTVRVVL